MSKFTVYVDYYFDGNIREKYEGLDPEDYLDIEDKNALYDKLQEDLQTGSDGNWGDVNCEELYDVAYDIPKEFFEEWKRLKESQRTLESPTL